MEYLNNCVLCGSSKESFRPYARRGKYGIVRCASCGLVFVNPRDDQRDILGQYVDDVSSPVTYYENTARVDSLIFAKRLEWVERFAKKGTLLDIGCNVGTFLSVATPRGWDAVGVDANPHAISVSKEKGYKTFHGLFGPDLIATMNPKEFDLVCLNDVVEHFPNPLESLKHVRSVVKSDGFLALNTPNFDSIVARTFQIKPREHIFFFDEKTIRRILLQAGFEIVLLKKAGRRRDFGSLQAGATIHNPAWLAVCKALHVSGLEYVANLALESLFTDELFVLARNPSASRDGRDAHRAVEH
jgi:2-polyprenyl-3-methyl-5-hydroxy-6-metoxy-1,4-benzoquinol methylase